MHRALLSLVVLSSSLALADLTLVSDVTANGKTRTVTLSVKGSRAYFDVTEDGLSRGMLRDTAQKKMWVLDHAKKAAIVVSEEDSKALEARQAQFRAQMKAQIEKLPAEQRARAEATMLAMTEPPKPASFTYEKKKGSTRKVSGISCDDYVVKREGKPAGEACFATWKAVGLEAETFRKTMLESMPTAAMSGMTQAFDASHNSPGFPLERTMLDANGTPSTHTVVKSVAKTALAAEKFEVPKDYVERVMKEAAPGGAPAPTPPPPAAKP